MEAATTWLKVLHIISLSIWAALLFYLPGLLAAHTRPMEAPAFFRLRAVSRIAYLGVASPAAIVAILSGSLLIVVANAHGGWLALKIAAVALLVAFHVYCGSVLFELRSRPAQRSRAALLALIAVPGILVPLILFLVLYKPV